MYQSRHESITCGCKSVMVVMLLIPLDVREKEDDDEVDDEVDDDKDGEETE